ncbi:corrinoid protein [Candidatus Contubernalis alkaliaceticus]|uniref:corrinoid protein n=1 Tax=Candidatus Contubernalis alkaliaceticus TaxID=338645 RepID=UPI001F4C4FCA|nr:corrinoid protein [Candidatus Contubernalis alkalaceticus]UNC91567.1 corrinoid protein [Candidatus Contubernalis alkalaceticus]
MSEERAKELFNELKQGVIIFDEERVASAAQAVVDEGIDAFKAINQGLVPGMEEVGDLYEKQEYFISELLLCAEALYAGLNILEPNMKKRKARVSGALIIGVVQGDVHDIGKNIIKMVFEVTGFEIHDLGRDVPVEEFVEKALSIDVDIVCLSAMMTTTMVNMKEVILRIKEKNPNVKVLIGGAPVNEDIAQRYGADGYADDPKNAIQKAVDLLSVLKEIVEDKDLSS